MQDPKGQVTCWLEIFSEYNFNVIHRLGPWHGNADALSQLPCRQCGQDTQKEENFKEDTDEGHAVNQQVTAISEESDSWCPRWSKEEIRTLQKADSDINMAISSLNKSLPSNPPKGESPILQTLWH